MLLICLTCLSAMAQKVVTTIAVLNQPIDAKTASAGQQLIFRVAKDVVVDNQVVIPRGSKIMAHVGKAEADGKHDPKSSVCLVIDKVVLSGSTIEMPLQGIIAAIAAPPNAGGMADDPQFGMMHSMSAGQGREPQSLSSESPTGPNAAVKTAQMKQVIDVPTLLTDDSAGAIGMNGVTLKWELASPPPATVINSKSKDLRLASGTQMLIRMAPPALPK
jgi:hypothetical protein